MFLVFSDDADDSEKAKYQSLADSLVQQLIKSGLSQEEAEIKVSDIWNKAYDHGYWVGYDRNRCTCGVF